MQKQSHSEPSEIANTSSSGGGMKHSRLHPSGFTWPKQCEKALKKKLQRAISLARTNPDYRIKHPNECRDNPECKVLSECHPEAKK